MEHLNKLEQNNSQITKIKDELVNLESTILERTQEGLTKKLKDEFLKTYPFFRATNGASGYADTNQRTGFLGLSGTLVSGKAPNVAVYRTIIPRTFSLNNQQRTTIIRGSGSGAANSALYAWTKAPTEWAAFLKEYKDKNIGYLIQTQEDYLNSNPKFREYDYKPEWDKFKNLESINTIENKFTTKLSEVKLQKQQELENLLQDNLNFVKEVTQAQEKLKEELETLQNKNKEKEQQLEILKQENEENLEQLENLQQQLETEKQREQELLESLEQNKIDLSIKEAKEKELESLKIEMERLSSEFVEINLDSLESQRDELLTSLRELKEQVENEENKQKAENLKNEIERLKIEIEFLKENESFREFENLQSLKNELQVEKENLENDLENAQTNSQDLKDQILSLKNEIERLKENESLILLESLKEELKTLSYKKEELELEIKELDSEMAKKREEINKLEIEVAKLLEKRVQLLKEMKDTLQGENLEKLIQSLSKEIFLLQGRENLWTPFYELKLIHQLLDKVDLRERDSN